MKDVILKAYIEGFAEKCAEYNIDPSVVIKFAKQSNLGVTINDVISAIKNIPKGIKSEFLSNLDQYKNAPAAKGIYENVSSFLRGLVDSPLLSSPNYSNKALAAGRLGRFALYPAGALLGIYSMLNQKNDNKKK